MTIEVFRAELEIIPVLRRQLVDELLLTRDSVMLPCSMRELLVELLFELVELDSCLLVRDR